MVQVKKSTEELRMKASEGGGKEALEKWRKRGNGKLGARERYVDFNPVVES